MFKVGYYQFHPKFLEPEDNLERISKSIEQLEKFDLLVLPELANSGYLFVKHREVERVAEPLPEGYFTTKLQELAEEKNAYIVSGVCEKKGSVYFNSSVMVGPEKFFAYYRKVHLFDREKLFFRPGDGPFQVHNIRGAKVGMLICFDWIFPEATRVLALKGMTVLAHSANLVLPYCQTAMLARSVENQIFTITANRIGTETNENLTLTFTGQSQITSPKMERLAKAPKDEEQITFVEIDSKIAENKNINERNNLFLDRRVELYNELVKKLRTEP